MGAGFRGWLRRWRELALVDAFRRGVVDQGMHAAVGAVGLEDLVGNLVGHGALRWVLDSEDGSGVGGASPRRCLR